MTPEHAQLLESLLTDQPVGSLSVLLDGEPYVGMVPYAATSDYASLLIHASDLAKHSAGLTDDAPFAFLLYPPFAPTASVLQIPRVSFQGVVQMLSRDDAAYLSAKETYISKHPSSAQIFSFRDFNLYALHIRKGRFVAGFGKTYNVTLPALKKLSRGEDSETTNIQE
jgi:hypothetical protein